MPWLSLFVKLDGLLLRGIKFACIFDSFSCWALGSRELPKASRAITSRFGKCAQRDKNSFWYFHFSRTQEIFRCAPPETFLSHLYFGAYRYYYLQVEEWSLRNLTNKQVLVIDLLSFRRHYPFSRSYFIFHKNRSKTTKIKQHMVKCNMDC